MPSFLHKILQTQQGMSSPQWRRLIYLISSSPCIWMQSTGIYPITSCQSEWIPHSNNFNRILRGDLQSFGNINMASEPIKQDGQNSNHKLPLVTLSERAIKRSWAKIYPFIWNLWVQRMWRGLKLARFGQPATATVWLYYFRQEIFVTPSGL